MTTSPTDAKVEEAVIDVIPSVMRLASETIEDCEFMEVTPPASKELLDVRIPAADVETEAPFTSSATELTKD